MQPLKLEAGIHLVRDTPFTRRMRHLLRDPNFMTYYHTGSGTWVAGTWLNKTAGVFLENEIIGPDITKVSRELVSNILFDRSSYKLKWLAKIRQELRLKNRRELNKVQEAADYHYDIREFLRKRSGTVRDDNPMWASL